MNPIEEQLGKLHSKTLKPERRGPAKVVDVISARASNHVDAILGERAARYQGRGNRWTEDQKDRLRAIVDQYQSLAIRMMGGEDVSQELHDVFVRARSLVSPQISFTGVEALKEILIRWLASIHTSLFPE